MPYDLVNGEITWVEPKEPPPKPVGNRNGRPRTGMWLVYRADERRSNSVFITRDAVDVFGVGGSFRIVVDYPKRKMGLFPGGSRTIGREGRLSGVYLELAHFNIPNGVKIPAVRYKDGLLFDMDKYVPYKKQERKRKK